jgi:putative AlgH/UPF0301 family transcriptional regulator
MEFEAEAILIEQAEEQAGGRGSLRRGAILLSRINTSEGVFRKAVVLLLEHSESGSVGVIINKRGEGVEWEEGEEGMEWEEGGREEGGSRGNARGRLIGVGGPLHSDQLLFRLSPTVPAGEVLVEEGVDGAGGDGGGVGGAVGGGGGADGTTLQDDGTTLQSMTKGWVRVTNGVYASVGPVEGAAGAGWAAGAAGGMAGAEESGSKMICVRGYAGWGPKQLGAEIVRGLWVVMSLDEDEEESKHGGGNSNSSSSTTTATTATTTTTANVVFEGGVNGLLEQLVPGGREFRGSASREVRFQQDEVMGGADEID